MSTVNIKRVAAVDSDHLDEGCAAVLFDPGMS